MSKLIWRCKLLDLRLAPTLALRLTPAIKRKMLQGIDDLAVTLQYKAMIENFETKYLQSKPWLFPK